jgi:hypothetical protein
VSRVTVIIKNQIGMSARTTEPAVDLVAVLFDRGPHGALGRFAIGPGGRGNDIVLMTESLSKVIIGSPYVLP